MWYRKIILAERGKITLPIAIRELGQMINQAVIKDTAGNAKIDIAKLDSLIKNNFKLSPYIKGARESFVDGMGGMYDIATKTIEIHQIQNIKEIGSLIGVIEHELIHGFDPALGKKQNQLLNLYSQLGSVKYSYDENLKLQALWSYLLENDYPEKESFTTKTYWKDPASNLELFDHYMQEDPEGLSEFVRKQEGIGVFFNRQLMNREQYAIHQKKYINQINQIASSKYFDNMTEPTAWMAQIDRQFSPGNFVAYYASRKKLDKNVSRESYIKYLRDNLFISEFAGKGIHKLGKFMLKISNSQDSSKYFMNMTDPKIKNQILERIGNNIQKADLLLQGGLLKLSNLELRTLNPQYADHVREYLKSLPVELQKKFYITQDINGNFKGNFQGIQFSADEYQNQATLANWENPYNNKLEAKLSLPFSDKLGNNTVAVNPNTKATEIYKYCNNESCPSHNKVIKGNEKAKFCKGCGKRLRFTTKLEDIPQATTEKVKVSQPFINSDEISQKTSTLPDINKASAPQSTSNLSKILPTLKKLFTALNAILDKFNNSKAGKVFNYAMLAKDVLFIITLINNITEQIKNNEQVMMKDQLDLGLTIVSLLTDQQTQAILRTIYPPIMVLLNNPQVQAWLVGINVSANVLSGAVTVADYLGTLAGTSNKSEGATAGVQNVPGGAQALVMPVFQLFDKYGEVYNALIDNEKGMTTEQAIAKHIMKDASGGIEPYRLSLFYKFRENKNKILEYQKSPAFKKLPVENQVLYPNANSAYAISSYKKAKDAQAKARQDAYNRNFGPGSGGVSRIPVQ